MLRFIIYTILCLHQSFHSASFRHFDSDSSCSTSTVTSNANFRDRHLGISRSKSRSFHGAHHNHRSQHIDDSFDSFPSSQTSSISVASSAVVTERVTLDLEASGGKDSGSSGAGGGGLGITILGRRQEAGGGIFVGAVKPEGAARRSGRIRPGDLLIEVNGIALTDMPNEQALTTLRDQVCSEN